MTESSEYIYIFSVALITFVSHSLDNLTSPEYLSATQIYQVTNFSLIFVKNLQPRAYTLVMLV